MRLVIEYQVGDGCTYSCTDTRPVEYESAEAFAVDFEKKCKEMNRDYQQNREYSFVMGGQEFDFGLFFEGSEYYAPRIFTVEEWFEYNGLE